MKERMKLTLDDWETIKTASIRGVPDKIICERYSLSPNTLAVRRFRDPIWREAARKKGKGHQGKNEELHTLLVDNREALALENQVLLSQYVHGKIKSVITKDALNDPENWGEMKVANELFRKSVGLDKEQSAVTLNFGWATTDNSEPLCEFSLDAASDIC